MPKAAIRHLGARMAGARLGDESTLVGSPSAAIPARSRCCARARMVGFA